MQKNRNKNHSKTPEKMFSLFSITLLLLAWYLGGLNPENNRLPFLEQISAPQQRQKINTDLYKIKSSQESQPPNWVSFGQGIGYGGTLSVGVEFTNDGQIQTIALLSSKETPSYFNELVVNQLPDSLLNMDIKQPIKLDAISGATLTSNAYMNAIEQATDPVREQILSYRLSQPTPAWMFFQWFDFIALLFFALAILINRTRSKYKAKMNSILLTLSTLVFGLYSASLYSSSTMSGLLTSVWLTGVASYTPFILLLLSIAYILYFNRNIYCQSLCPFGAAQQCLAKIGNAKPSPLRAQFFVWFPRFLLLLTLSAGIFYRSPNAFTYEPFGIAFGMIGGIYLFILTILIILTSLVIRRPWCQSLCPIHVMTDFIVFNKNWFNQKRKKLNNKHKGR